jgi:hypothetical protein
MEWLRLPGSPPVATATALLLLTGLDLLGSAAAQEAVERRSAPIAAGGALIFVAMFFVFAATLRISGLVVITVGWCVLVQVGVVLMDHFRSHVTLPPAKLLAVALAVAAQVYLVAGPAAREPRHRAAGPATVTLREYLGWSPARPKAMADSLSWVPDRGAATVSGVGQVLDALHGTRSMPVRMGVSR